MDKEMQLLMQIEYLRGKIDVLEWALKYFTKKEEEYPPYPLEPLRPYQPPHVTPCTYPPYMEPWKITCERSHD